MNSNYTTENQPTIKPESSEKRLHWPSFIIGSSKKRLYPPPKINGWNPHPLRAFTNIGEPNSVETRPEATSEVQCPPSPQKH